MPATLVQFVRHPLLQAVDTTGKHDRGTEDPALLRQLLEGDGLILNLPGSNGP
jgi:hypothetical protein